MVTTSPTAGRYRAAVSVLISMIEDGATFRDVAAFVQAQSELPIAASLSRFIESEAAPGTFAEAVFDVLCGDL